MGNLLQQPTCVNCNKLYGKRDTHLEQVRWKPSKGETMPPYRGNLKVVSISRKPKKWADQDDQWAWYRVWDGTYWSSGCDPFCTQRCALAFARKAVAAGYGTKKLRERA